MSRERERIFTELMTSDRKLKASREGCPYGSPTVGSRSHPLVLCAVHKIPSQSSGWRWLSLVGFTNLMRARACFLSKVGGFVPQTQNVNLT